MKKYIVRLLILLSCFVATSSVAYVVFSHKNKHYQAFERKWESLRDTPGSRLIFIGGSSIATDLDSKRVMDSLHVTVVNAGFSINFGLRFLMDDLQQYLHEGDVVVIVPEYQHFYNFADGRDSGELSLAMDYYHWKRWVMLNEAQRRNAIMGYTHVVRNGFKALLSRSDSKVEYNTYGDEVGHWGAKSHFVFSPENFAITQPFNADFASSFVLKLNQLSLQNKVILLPPALVESGYKLLEEQILEVTDFLQSNGHPFIVKPYEHMMSDSLAYDACYHVDKTGVDIFTEKVILELAEN
jgi:hypothetical protein